MIILFLILFQSLNAKITTLYESSQFKQTGRYEEVIRLCSKYAKLYPRWVSCQEFGKTPEGRPMKALVLSSKSIFNIKKAVKQKQSVVFFQGGIHSGEIDGKDAGFLLFKELLNGKEALKKVENLILVFVPVLNIDGHERFGKHNRPNQIGPEEMGWRVTSKNLNLNRDYLKVESLEMQNLLRYLHEWNPILYLDLHVTDGAQFQPDVAILVNPTLKGSEKLRAAASKLTLNVLENLKKRGHLPLSFYPSFINEDEPTSGIEAGVGPLRFSQSYWGSNNRIGVLVETHSWKNYEHRVNTTLNVLKAFIEEVSHNYLELEQASAVSSDESKKIAGKEMVLSYKPTKKSEIIEFPGYHFTREKSAVSNTIKTVYYPEKKEIWKMPFFNELEPNIVIKAPLQGYWVPSQYKNLVIEKLRTHQIQFLNCEKGGEYDVDVFRANESEFAKSSYEGRQRLTVKGTWKQEKQVLLPYSIFIPVNQPKSNLLIHLFEPVAEDSLLSWGFFNSHFEKKEYMEAYVTETVALEILEKNAVVKKEFEDRLDKDAEFAKDSAKRLEFFYEKHPSYDQKYRLYPIFRFNSEKLALSCR